MSKQFDAVPGGQEWLHKGLFALRAHCGKHRSDGDAVGTGTVVQQNCGVVLWASLSLLLIKIIKTGIASGSSFKGDLEGMVSLS